MKKELKTKILNSVVQTTKKEKSLILQYDNMTIIQVILILSLYTTYMGFFISTLDFIVKKLNLSINKDNRKKVKDILNILKEEELIEINTEVKSGMSLEIDTTNLREISRNYFIISDSEFEILNSIENAKTRNNAFAVYCELVSRAGENKYCYPSYETIMKDIGIGTKGLVKSLQTLQEKELIIYGNKGYSSNKCGAKKSNNTYVIISKFKDYFEAEEYFLKLVQEDKEDKNDKIINLKDKKTDNLVKEDKSTIDSPFGNNPFENSFTEQEIISGIY